MVVRDAADIIESVIAHLLYHADEVFVTDHRSVDGTRELLEALPVRLTKLDERGFPEDETRTAVIHQAWQAGHDWVLYNDADEIWQVENNPDVRIADFLAALPDDIRVVGGDTLDHVATALDPPNPDPVSRLGWRQEYSGTIKGVFRLTADAGYSKHTATYSGVVAPYNLGAFTAHHYSARSPEHFISKIRNGLDSASVEAGMPVGYDVGWTQWKGMSDDELRAAYYERFYYVNPGGAGLVYDPAPVKR
jgi:hypothetical protein